MFELERLFKGSILPSLDIKFPFLTFPLNTDGIDVSGRNHTIKRVKITNYDDAVVVKPLRTGNVIKCSENIFVEDMQVNLGVGMSIGSVSPDEGHSCIKNVAFRNVNFSYPFKAIYVKSNPGNTGDAIIQNITFENMHIDTPIWWGIYIGPQQ